MRSLDESRRRWEETLKDGGDVAALQRAVKFNGPTSPCEAGLRSVCWKTFLLFRDDEAAADRTLILREAREDYEALRGSYMRFIKHPERLTELTVDPLVDDPASPWDNFRRDELVRADILQDVRRLPDDAFYHQEEIQTLILDVLFVFCKEHPDAGGYRQGMHELLAPLVHVLSEDAIESGSLRTAVTPADADMVEMLDACFVEHDAYALFVKVMSKARAFYEMSTSTPNPTVASHETGTTGDLLSPFGAPGPLAATAVEESAIVELSKEIHEGTLMKVDPELATHLKTIDILPQIFLIRWIRLLFGREFPFKQHLVLWDSMFAFDPKLHLVPLISVAMLLRIRWKLLDADYSVALQSLLKYPAPQPPHGPHTFVDDAIYLRDHLDAAGGSNLILKYTGRAPSRVFSPAGSSAASSPRPTTPAAAFAAGLGSLRSRTLKVARSPLRSSRPSSGSGDGLGIASPGDASSTSPSRFIQGREGMEALFQGATKSVLERSEKLGINRAVRDAVGEIKRNMAQSYQDARQAAAAANANRDSAGNRGEVFSPTQTGKRLSYGEAMRIISDMERRNQQLASMLDETVTTLKTVARAAPSLAEALSEGEGDNSKGDSKAALEQFQQQQQQWLEEVELAAAKVQFVKVHLEDASLTLPLDDARPKSAGEDTHMSGSDKEATGPPTDLKPSPMKATAAPQTPLMQTAAPDSDLGPVTPLAKGMEDADMDDVDCMDMDEGEKTGENDKNGHGGPEKAPALPARSPDLPSQPVEAVKPETTQTAETTETTAIPARPAHTVPARSTLAQSSFSWMLEPGDTAGDDSSGTTSAALKKPPRPTAASRTRHAFLFGEVVNQSPLGGDAAGHTQSGDDPLADTRVDASDGRPRPVTTGDIFGLEPLRKALP